MSLAPPGVRRIGLDEYVTLLNDGRLAPGADVELLDGLLVPKMSKGPRHVAITRRIATLLRGLLPEGWTALKEDPIALPVEGPEGGGTVPEPDVAIVRGAETEYEDRFPGPEDVALIIEVAADARRLHGDRQGLARYARNGVPVVWVVNVPTRLIEVYTRPIGPGDTPVFEGVAVARPGDTLTLALEPRGGGGRVELPIAVAGVLA